MSEIFKYTKICTYCKEEKGLAEFVRCNGKITSRCFACNNKLSKERFKKSPLCSKNGSPWFNICRMDIRKKPIKEESENELRDESV